MNRTLALILVAGFLVEQAVGADVLSRSQHIGDALRGEAYRTLISVAVGRASPLGAFASVRRAVALEPQEAIHLLSDDGHVFGSIPVSLGLPPPLRVSLLAEPLGVGTYHAFNGDGTDVVRRDYGWSRQVIADRDWIVVVERDRPLERVSEEPLTGRWMGAYSYTGMQVGAEPVGKEAGPLSVLILQEGQRCQLRAVFQRWNARCEGMVSGTNLVVSADSSPENPTLILEASYAPGEDKIRGTIHFSGAREAGRATVFLQRASE